jgi:hypothetical protein
MRERCLVPAMPRMEFQVNFTCNDFTWSIDRQDIGCTAESLTVLLVIKFF